MPAPVLVLNGASSSGKTSLGRALQRRLGLGWFLLGIDDLLRAVLPDGDEAGLLEVGTDGVVRTGERFRQVEAAWYAGLAEVARRSAGLVVDDVLLDGRASQERLAGHLRGLPLVWVGVVCEPGVGAAREQERGDRVLGMHAEQRERVHAGVRYDHVCDTTSVTPDEAAVAVLRDLRARGLLTAGPASEDASLSARASRRDGDP